MVDFILDNGGDVKFQRGVGENGKKTAGMGGASSKPLVVDPHLKRGVKASAAE
jgi:hypothetical protein